MQKHLIFHLPLTDYRGYTVDLTLKFYKIKYESVFYEQRTYCEQNKKACRHNVIYFYDLYDGIYLIVSKGIYLSVRTQLMPLHRAHFFFKFLAILLQHLNATIYYYQMGATFIIVARCIFLFLLLHLLVKRQAYKTSF